MSRVRNRCWGGMLLACLLAASNGAAATVTREEFDVWLKATDSGQYPQSGSVLGQADLEQVRALIPPRYFDEFSFPDVALEIQASASYTPHPVYSAATARFDGQAKLTADGAVENYTAGRPFDPQQFDDVPPDRAGYMVAWNHIYRWQYYGYQLDELVMSYVRPTADGSAGTLTEGLRGGGNVERFVTSDYHRVYLNHLAMLPEQGYKVGASDSDKRHWKDYMEYFEPFDVKGTKFVIERSANASEEDQVNSYLPAQRRVRRLSAQERADSFMGSDFTLDDFEGFSGRVLDYTWTYLGTKTVLDVADSKNDKLELFGPSSHIPLDRWQIRQCFAVELKPRWSGHPVSSKILLIDQETYNVAYTVIFNRNGELWKVIGPNYKLPNAAAGETLDFEDSVPAWRGSVAIDFIANTASVARPSVANFPRMSDSQIERTFNVSNLSEGR